MIVRELGSLTGGTVTEDVPVDCLIRGNDGGEFEIEYTVSAGSSLDFSMVDVSDADVDLHVTVHMEAGARCDINVASICMAGRRKNYTFDTVHFGEDGVSHTRLAGINAGNGTLLFKGNGDIRRGAHGCKTRQEGKITNLSADSRSEVSPALLIKEDKVDASHGAAVGAYDPNAIYYLMSRGLTESESRSLITIGSLIPVVDKMRDSDLAAEALESIKGVVF